MKEKSAADINMATTYGKFTAKPAVRRLKFYRKNVPFPAVRHVILIVKGLTKADVHLLRQYSFRCNY
jgi:hypothetical protein